MKSLMQSGRFILASTLMVLLVSVSLPLPASSITTPTESLRVAVDGLIGIITNGSLSDAEKKTKMEEIIDTHTDMEAMSQRIIAQLWRTSPDDGKVRFIAGFKKVLVNTYYAMLKKYSGEEVEYLGEEIQKEHYASVDTNIVSGNRKTPVKFRMILRDGQWRLYDYVVEGVSMVRTYNSSYKSALNKGGIGLLNNNIDAELASKDAGAGV